MKLYSFILLPIFFFVLKPDEGVHCNIYHAQYKKYIERVVSCIYLQIIYNQKQNSNGEEEAFQQYTDLRELKLKYNYAISVLNFEYTKIIKKFLEYVAIIIRKCHQCHKNNLLQKFVSCVILLEDQIKNSKTMFENLHNAMKFISYIDIRFLFFEFEVPHTIIEEIDFIYQFVSEKNLENSPFDLNKSFNQISKIKLRNFVKFLKDSTKIVNSLTEHNKYINPSIKTHLENIEINERSKKNNSSDVYSKPPNKFYNETIKIWYKNLGFEEFLEPIEAEFIPPIDPKTNQNDGIKALNVIRKEPGWKSMNHINIVYFGKQISVNRIINDEVSNINFRIKKEHITQFLRCRYTEIIKEYHTILSSIMHVCQNDIRNFYHNCLIKLFNSFKKSEKMIEGLYKALVALNRSSIWSVNFNSKSSLHKLFKWVTIILRFLKNNNFNLDNFMDKYDIEIVIIRNPKETEIIKKLLNIFKTFLKDIGVLLRSDVAQQGARCYTNKRLNKIWDYTKSFINSFNTLNNNNNPYLDWQLQIYLNACNYFDKFCADVYKSCYEDLGFQKIIDCQHKELHHDLIPYTVDLST
ncbi:uncharacterized protein LOC126907928 isoform X8 [Daktulosphaira vitifoliae]|uniref:uncharacterized protein LOC126907928 isoform X7 n=1 Tax=Daktulosphaira vitifoliae TaxID=58002 RepID=UPI0021AABC3C|nr:uncharacterized protein LOC126907928 isoform X7 [Daktulosphaira vitifoliae]XP_050545588.1 uncharacterized protein LOC126907928 isoform X8 [Daktulosphaira vitifoliae]